MLLLKGKFCVLNISTKERNNLFNQEINNYNKTKN